MREIFFDVWPGDDILGTSLGELTDASDKRYQHVFNGIGSGSFAINRHSAQYDWVTPGPTTPEPVVRVRRVPGGPFAYDSPNYIGAFFVEEGDDEIVSSDEEGGEDATRSGRTVEAILSRAIVDFEAHYVDDIAVHPYDKTALTDGQWHIQEDIPGSFVNAGAPGAVLRIFLRNWGAMTPEPIPELTHDFNINNDSTGTPWEDGDAEWAFDVGTEGLDILATVIAGGLYYRISPAFLLSAYNDHPGTDRSAVITLEHGVDIATSANRTIHASAAKSRLLVQGASKNGRRKYRWVADTGVEAALGVRQGKFEYGASRTNSVLDKAGNRRLDDLKHQHEGVPTMGVLELDGQEAFIDYFPGDRVTVAIPGVYPSTSEEIKSITLVETETGECDPIIEFGGVTWDGIGVSDSGTGICCSNPAPLPFVTGPNAAIIDVNLSIGSVSGRSIHYASQVGASLPIAVPGNEYRLVFDQTSDFALPGPPPNYSFMDGANFSIWETAEGPLQADDWSPDDIYPYLADAPYTPGKHWETEWREWTGSSVALDIAIGGTMISGFFGGLWAGRLQLQMRVPGAEDPVGTPAYGQPVIEHVGSDGTNAPGSPTDVPYAPLSLVILVNGVDMAAALTETDPEAGTYELLNPIPEGAEITRRYLATGITV